MGKERRVKLWKRRWNKDIGWLINRIWIKKGGWSYEREDEIKRKELKLNYHDDMNTF